MDEMQEEASFAGFEYANPALGFTQIGNRNFALLALIDNLAELKVVIFLMRNTWGYGEYGEEKAITTDEFINGRKRKDGSRIEEGCGLKRTGVKEGLAKGIEHGRILCTVDTSDRGRIKKLYSLKMDEATKPNKDELEGRSATLPGRDATLDGRHTDLQGRNADLRSSHGDHRTEKETLETHPKEKHLKKDISTTPLQRDKPSQFISSLMRKVAEKLQETVLDEHIQQAEHIYGQAKGIDEKRFKQIAGSVYQAMSTPDPITKLPMTGEDAKRFTKGTCRTLLEYFLWALRREFT